MPLSEIFEPIEQACHVYRKKSDGIRLKLQAVIYPEGKWWIAHCLELDLVAEGKNPSEALSDLMDLVDTQIQTAMESGRLESIFRPAPPQIWAMYSEAGDYTLPRKRKANPFVERFEAREMAVV